MIANPYERLQATPGVDYRDFDVPTEDAFIWEDGIEQTGPNGLYGVEFTSAQNLGLKALAPEMFTVLHTLDDAARRDAEGQDGFNWYFADEVSGEGKARSFCLWDTREHAVAASQRQAHKDAVGYAMAEDTREVYDHYGVHKFRLERQANGIIAVTTLARIAVSRGVLVGHQLFPENERAPALVTA